MGRRFYDQRSSHIAAAAPAAGVFTDVATGDKGVRYAFTAPDTLVFYERRLVPLPGPSTNGGRGGAAPVGGPRRGRRPARTPGCGGDVLKTYTHLHPHPRTYLNTHRLWVSCLEPLFFPSRREESFPACASILAWKIFSFNLGDFSF